MSVTLQWDGLDEFKRELFGLPEDLGAEADRIVDATANAAAEEIRAGYGSHRVTGNLQDHVFVSRLDRGKVTAARIVKNTAPHAFIFENGTQARHTDLGANRGAMPPGHVFVPVIVRRRRAMNEELKALLVSKGLTVTGDA